jgi:hypothetical protein
MVISRCERSNQKRGCATPIPEAPISSLLPKRGCLPRFVRRERVAKSILIEHARLMKDSGKGGVRFSNN